MTIIFFGSSEYSVIILQALLKAGYQPQVVTDTTPVTQFCQKNKITFFPSGHQVKTSSVDLIISADYGRKIPQSILKLAKIGSLNLHPSLLPKYRGATPVPHALLAGDKTTGITIIQMTNKIDSGPILTQQTIPISPQDNAETLLKKCYSQAAQLLIKSLPNYIEHKITPKPQPTKSPTVYARRFTKQDGYISWPSFKSALSTNGEKVYNQVRALHPWPGVYTSLPNNKTLKIISAKLAGEKLLPTSVQLPGKNPISWKAFLAGYQHLLQ